MERRNVHVGIVAFSDVDSGFDLANALCEAGMRVSLFMSHNRLSQSLRANANELEAVYELKQVHREIPIHSFKFPRFRDLRSYFVTRSLKDTMDQQGIDIVHLLLGPGEIWMAFLAMMIRQKPVVTTIVIPQPNIGDPLPQTLHHLVNLIAICHSEMIVVNGFSQQNWLVNKYKVSVRRVSHVPLYPRVTAARYVASTIPEEPGTILFFGEARPHKGLAYLIRSQPLITKQIPNARILISSYGADLERSLQMITDSSCFEIHVGYARDEDVASYFRRASLVVLPYLSASTSGILGTAYAFEKPVVVTNVGCLSEYVVDGVTGRLIPPANEAALAEAIVMLLSNDESRWGMGKNARRWMEQTMQTVILRTLQVYEQASQLHKGRIRQR